MDGLAALALNNAMDALLSRALYCSVFDGTAGLFVCSKVFPDHQHLLQQRKYRIGVVPTLLTRSASHQRRLLLCAVCRATTTPLA